MKKENTKSMGNLRGMKPVFSLSSVFSSSQGGEVSESRIGRYDEKAAGLWKPTTYLSDPPLIFVMCSNPKPDEIPIFFTSQRPVTSTDPYCPKVSYLFKTKRRVSGI